MSSVFLTAEWRKLILVQYELEPEVLEPFLPSGVELDLYQPTPNAQARCYVSLVGFLFDKVRVKGIPIPLHTRFEEINLRFYVRRREPDGTTKRGVVFIREFVPRRAIAWLASRFYEEPYIRIPTRHEIKKSSEGLSVRYDWKLGGRWHSLSALAAIPGQDIGPGSEEEFVTEHYWGYTKRSRGAPSAYAVEHTRWQVYPVKSYAVDADFGLLYGPEFAFLNQQPVASVLLAEGAPVTVRSGFRVS